MAAAFSLLALGLVRGLRRNLTRPHGSCVSPTVVRPGAGSSCVMAPARVRPRTNSLMHKALITVAVQVLVLLGGALAAARPTNQEMRNLKQAHRQQWKSLKKQERAEKDALERHPQTAESRKLFKHDMEEQRRLVKQVQKSEIRGLKESQHAAKRQASRAKHKRSAMRPEAP